MTELTRREFLATAGAAMAVDATYTQAHAATAKPRVIAVEESFATHEFLDALNAARAKTTVPGTSPLFGGKLRDSLADLQARLDDMDANGVDMHVLSLVLPGVQIFDPAAGSEMARKTNDYLAATISKYPKRFAGLAAVAPQDPDGAAREIERAINTLGLGGVIINSHTQGHWLDEPQFRPVLAAAEQYRAPIYLHPTFPPESMNQPLQSYGMDGPLWGFGAECALHAVRLIVSGVFDRFPNLQIVLGHMGEALPYWLFRLDHRHTEGLKLDRAGKMVALKRLPSEYFRSNFHITTSGIFDDGPLEYALKHLGVERVMFAIDYPWESSAMAMKWIQTAPVTAQQRAQILHGNAERLFRIKAVSTS